MLRQQIINILEISDTVKNDILGALCEMYFEDRTIYVLKYKTDEPVLWDNDCYARRADSNHKLTIEECCHLSKKFYKA